MAAALGRKEKKELAHYHYLFSLCRCDLFVTVVSPSPTRHVKVSIGDRATGTVPPGFWNLNPFPPHPTRRHFGQKGTILASRQDKLAKSRGRPSSKF